MTWVNTDVWTVVSNGQLIGRFPEPQLVHWVASGQVSPNDLFFRDGMRVAAPAHTIQPFAAYFPPFLRAEAYPTRGSDPTLRWILPVGRSSWSIAAGYLGLFSILGVFGPLAILAGVLGLRQISRKPQLLGTGRAIFGIVAGVIGTLILAVWLTTR